MNPNQPTHTNPLSEEERREFEYLRRINERNAAKILHLDMQSIAIRHELEQKRRGFSLIAELAVTMARDGDYGGMFTAASRRINAALNMQRTAVLTPVGDGTFRAQVLQGYSPDEEWRVAARRFKPSPELLVPTRPVLVTGADPDDRLRQFRIGLALPYFVSCPVFLHNEAAAILVTGRVIERIPFLTRLGPGDVETVQTVAAFLAAMLAGRKLLEAEERVHIMLDATPLCCNFWDEKYNNIDCNEEAARLFELSSKQEYLDRFIELSPEYQPDGRPSGDKAMEKIREAFTSGYVRFEWLHQKLNGEPIPSEITLVRVKREDGYIVAGYTRDLREQKAMLAQMRQTQNELRLALDMAEKNAKTKTEFLANMSHEIRTPMNAVIGMTHLLAGTDLAPKQREYVDKASHSANLLLHVINDILDFSKIDADRMEIERIPFSLRRTIRNVTDMVTTQAREKELALLATVNPDVPDMVMGDPMRIEQVLLNLAGNAVKFTRQGSVSIQVALNGGDDGHVRLLFEVADTGIGMSEKQMATLFQPFTQADTSTTRKYGGTGLGLAISKSLITLMGGEVWCRSMPGVGSTFFVEIPMAVAETEDAAVMEAIAGDGEGLGKKEADHDSLRGMRVLLAEDNAINQMIAMELLSSKGVLVTPVFNGREALEALEHDSYDVVLMDIQMPEMDGLTATAKLRADPRFADLPVIAMTAHAMAGDREVSLGGGMNDHVTKPIDPQVLYVTLAKWDRRGA